MFPAPTCYVQHSVTSSCRLIVLLAAVHLLLRSMFLLPSSRSGRVMSESCKQHNAHLILEWRLKRRCSLAWRGEAGLASAEALLLHWANSRRGATTMLGAMQGRGMAPLTDAAVQLVQSAGDGPRKLALLNAHLRSSPSSTQPPLPTSPPSLSPAHAAAMSPAAAMATQRLGLSPRACILCSDRSHERSAARGQQDALRAAVPAGQVWVHLELRWCPARNPWLTIRTPPSHRSDGAGWERRPGEREAFSPARAPLPPCPARWRTATRSQ